MIKWSPWRHFCSVRKHSFRENVAFYATTARVDTSDKFGRIRFGRFILSGVWTAV